MILAWRHVPEPTIASIADEPTARDQLSASARLHLDTCDRCQMLLEGHARAARLLHSDWRLVTADELATSGATIAVRPRVGAGSALGRSPTMAGSWVTIALVVGLLIALVAGALLLVGSRRGLARDNTLVFARGGDLFTVDPDGGAETDLGRGAQPVWSPDKSRIAFSVAPQQPQGGSEDEVWVMARDGTDRRRLATGVFEPAVWSPDGRALLVAYPNFVILPIDGGRPRELRMSPYKASGNGSWAPDGSRVALVDGTSNLHVVDLGGDGFAPRRVLHSGGLPWQVNWSPDGSTIAFAADGIRLVRPDGSADRILVPSLATWHSTRPFSPYALGWAPDSRRLAYAAPAGTGSDVGVYVVDITTGEPKAVFTPTEGRHVLSIAWSTDGRQLALGIGPGVNCGVNPDTGEVPNGSAVGIWIVGADGRGPHEVVPLSQADCQPELDW
jgi:hypothetical protein